MTGRKNDAISAEARHLRFLRTAIYQVETKWPHFGRMLDDLREIAAGVRDEQTVVCLERAYVYGGISMFAPLFPRGSFIAVDCETESYARGGYQAHWTEHPDCVKVPAHRRAPITDTGLPAGIADVLLVPNIVHHVRDQEGMFAEFARLLRPGGTGYVFEALLRELHQIPDDYVRYTPWGFETLLGRHGLELTETRPTGGPFEAITYCWVQALQYFPPEERVEREKWFYQGHFQELLALDRRHQKNVVRSHTEFPVAYGVFFRKPETEARSA